MTSNIKWILAIIAAGIVASGLIIWVVFFKTPTFTPDTTPQQFGNSETRTSSGVGNTSGINAAQSITESVINTTKVFKIANGPVAGATLIQTLRPATSTVVRFALANNGHIFDLVLDSPGAVAKPRSNTTIPGVLRTVWSEKGRGALVQYIDGGVIKTAHLALPSAEATTTTPVRIEFLQQGIANLDVSPDGASVTYLIKTANGSDIYTAGANGSNIKKLLSLPFSELQISWPAQGTLLAQTNSATGIPGVVFSIDAKTGASAPLVYASGLTAIADRTFGRVVYQTANESRSTYSQNVKTGLATPLSFDPIPELCRWSNATSTTLYCATPISYVAANYLDLWHMGAASAASTILKFDLSKGGSTIVASPGGKDGGEQSDITELAVSPDDSYLLFIRTGDRSLWGVRLKK